MTDSVLFDLLDKAYFIPLREYIEEHDDYADNRAHERKEKLIKISNKDQQKLLALFETAIVNRLDYVHRELEVHALSLGIEIGIELQKLFAEKK